ncbi:MAG: hypothetical protein LIO69_01415 [Oscillospiraceae bacterium]|nr:hypothetical protein [Oscillospiraceae bacterium]
MRYKSSRRNKKIFRPKRRYKIKRKSDSVIKIVVGVFIVGILVLVGYSIADPVSSFIEERANQSDEGAASEEDSYNADTNTEGAGEGEQTEAQSAESAASETTVSVSETETDLSAAESETSVGAMNYDVDEGGAAYSLNEEDLLDEAALKEKLANIRSAGYSAVIFPMKTEGGTFYYNTQIPLVAECVEGDDPVVSDITAEQLSELARSAGLRPVASVSVLYDNNRYGDFRWGAYRTTDGTVWLDTSPEKGGKPWLSPFDDTAKEFCCDIVTELAQAGFSEIICYDFIFPEFRTSDIEKLGDEVSVYGDRYQALTQLACLMTEAGKEEGAQVLLKITANSVIKSYSELFVPDELQGCTILVDYSEDNMSRTMVSDSSEIILDEMSTYDRVTAVYEYISDKAGDVDTVPMLDGASMSADEFTEAVRALTVLGYDRYYVY